MVERAFEIAQLSKGDLGWLLFATGCACIIIVVAGCYLICKATTAKKDFKIHRGGP